MQVLERPRYYKQGNENLFEAQREAKNVKTMLEFVT